MTELTPNPSYSLSIRVQLPNRAGMLASVMTAIGEARGNLDQVELLERTRHVSIRDISVDAASVEHAEQIVAAVKGVPDIKVLSVSDRTFSLHRGGQDCDSK